ncbi:hypothetical protein CDAR_600471 [Caerostris darwini]|uniref:Uncharacterized protein n=1 Tax=Caerostris darwini TaxID=1538125 RepID=A0AAV4TTZ1_9ARAC|nr:hypothetical protein CDAR_600471 [Caerostris darwini]
MGFKKKIPIQELPTHFFSLTPSPTKKLSLLEIIPREIPYHEMQMIMQKNVLINHFVSERGRKKKFRGGLRLNKKLFIFFPPFSRISPIVSLSTSAANAFFQKRPLWPAFYPPPLSEAGEQGATASPSPREWVARSVGLRAPRDIIWTVTEAGKVTNGGDYRKRRSP